MATPNLLGQTQDLAPYAAPYVTGMLGKGQAISNMPFTAYQGPLTAGQSDLQTQAYQGLGALTTPTAQMGGFTPTSFTSGATAQNYMSPYLQGALQPQYDAARRQADIAQEELQSRYGKAGAYGGSRQGIAEAELQRGLLDRMAGITGAGYQDAFQQAQNQFNIEQNRAQQAQNDLNTYGLQALAAQQQGGAEQRAIEQQGVMADIAQFTEERDFPLRQTQFQQSLLKGLPIGAQSNEYADTSALSDFLGSAGGILGLLQALNIVKTPEQEFTPITITTGTPTSTNTGSV